MPIDTDMYNCGGDGEGEKEDEKIQGERGREILREQEKKDGEEKKKKVEEGGRQRSSN